MFIFQREANNWYFIDCPPLFQATMRFDELVNIQYANRSAGLARPQKLPLAEQARGAGRMGVFAPGALCLRPIACCFPERHTFGFRPQTDYRNTDQQDEAGKQSERLGIGEVLGQ